MSVAAERTSVAEILERATSGERISDEDAVELLRSRDLVAVVEMPSRCASRITPSHSFVLTFFGAMILRTRSTSISAPPPGIESRPASRSRASVSGTVSFERRAACTISDGESACRCTG